MNAGTLKIHARDALTIKVRLVGVRGTIFRLRLGMLLVRLASRVLRSEVFVDAEDK